MSLIPDFSFRGALAALTLTTSLAGATPALAQEVAPVATPNADRLADEVRVLAREPRNVRALLSAGELSARLNDPSAAAGFFARAQAIEPGNPRVQVGQAMVMVRMERPGEALRLFDAAARAGLNMDDYASDRGLAYDLIGAQPHALRDHRIAMQRNPDDETRRRYALSLGISGQEDEAMKVLDPLLKRSDRAAWRARAFIMAMNGDAAGADKIAASMMGGFGTALAPFFRRLPALPAADKAFAVHFGEIRRTPARIADASVAPPLPVLRGEPSVAVAAAQPVRTPPPSTASRARPTTSARRPSRAEARRAAELQAAQQREAARLAQQEAVRVEAQRVADLRAQQERDAAAARQRETDRVAAEQAREAEARRVAEAQARDAAAAAEAQRLAEAQRVAEAQRLAEAQRVAAAQTQATPAASTPVAPAPPPVETASATPAAPSTPTPAPVEQRAAALPPPPATGREDNVIARIIAGITIPASELGVTPMPGAASEPAPTPQPQPQPQPQPAPVEVARAQPTPSGWPVSPRPAVVEKPRATAETTKPAATKTTKEKAAEEKLAATKGKPVDAKTKAAEAKAKAAEAKAKAKPDPAKTDPARTWVQVAGGANVSDLPKAWRGLVAKAPVEFKGKQAWTTPLRFTNRLLAGPFKTSAEAQAFVNAIGKKGLSAFAFTSEAGQKIEKLPAN